MPYFLPVIDWLGWTEIVSDILSFLVFQRLECLQVLLLDSHRVLEHHPVNRLFASTCSQGAVVVEILVHQDREEVDNVDILFAFLKLIIYKFESDLNCLTDHLLLKITLAEFTASINKELLSYLGKGIHSFTGIL